MPSFFFNGQPVQDQSMYYAGAVLPRDAVKPVTPSIDYTNNPSVIKIYYGPDYIVLPQDVMVMMEGEKSIAESMILDGVSVFEQISRKPFQIDFDCNIWEQNSDGKDVFPQVTLNDIFTNIFLPNTVLTVDNTYLNNLGIQQLIVKNISPATVRGSLKIPLRIKCYENVVGQSIIM